jgi:hypothetical protein
VPLSVLRGTRKPGARWRRSDTLLAGALLDYEARLNDLGIPRDEAMDPLHDGDNPYRTGEYVVDGPVRDHAVTALSRAQEQTAKRELKHPDGLRFGITFKPVTPAVPSQPPT